MSFEAVRDPEIAVVVVNYNGRHLLDDCLRSIREHAEVQHEIVVVDNASTDGSLEYLATKSADVKTVSSGTNLGFGKACNLGVKAARAPYVLLLNSDARLQTSVRPALDHLRANPTAAAVGGRLWYLDGRLQPSVGLESTPARLVLSWTGLGRIRCFPSIMRRMQMSGEYYTTPQNDVSWVSGALMLVERQAWDNVGGMAPEYFMYMEDVDFCRRVRDAGRRVDYIPSIAALHLEGGGREWIGERALCSTADSYLEYARRYYSPAERVFLRGGLATVFALRSVAFLGLSAIGRGARRERGVAFLRAAARLIAGGDDRCRHERVANRT